MVLPASTPVTIPLDEPTVAIDVLLLVHTPPVAGSLNKLVPATHTRAVPVMLPGSALTVTVAVV